MSIKIIVGIEAQIEKIANIIKIITLGDISTPAVVVDGQVKSAGKVPKKEEVQAWLKKEKAAA